jgi:hypothetical protein
VLDTDTLGDTPVYIRNSTPCTNADNTGILVYESQGKGTFLYSVTYNFVIH